jgi:hypothetical protein
VAAHRQCELIARKPYEFSMAVADQRQGKRTVTVTKARLSSPPALAAAIRRRSLECENSD